MVTVTATEFKAIINDTEITDASAEAIIDAAIDMINIYYQNGLSNLSGTPKSVTVTSQQRGSIMYMSKVVYSEVYKNADGGNLTVGNVGVVYSSDKLLSIAKRLGGQLMGRQFSRT